MRLPQTPHQTRPLRPYGAACCLWQCLPGFITNQCLQTHCHSAYSVPPSHSIKLHLVFEIYCKHHFICDVFSVPTNPRQSQACLCARLASYARPLIQYLPNCTVARVQSSELLETWDCACRSSLYLQYVMQCWACRRDSVLVYWGSELRSSDTPSLSPKHHSQYFRGKGRSLRE